MQTTKHSRERAIAHLRELASKMHPGERIVEGWKDEMGKAWDVAVLDYNGRLLVGMNAL